MNTANRVTFMRVWLSPILFIVFFLPRWFSVPVIPVIAAIVIIFATIEFSDLFDGKIARKRNQVSDFGKALDPFSDSLSRLTYFLCFVAEGYMPVWIFVLVLYRDLIVSFMRQIMAQSGTIMPSRMSGKIKAWVYCVTGIVGMLYHFTVLLGVVLYVPYPCIVIMYSLFGLSGLTAIWTLYDYAVVFMNRKGKNSELS